MNTNRLGAVAAALALVATGWLATTPPSHAEGDVPGACANEDGPGPCFWDAKHRGNGEGRSYFLSSKGNVHPLPHRLVHNILD